MTMTRHRHLVLIGRQGAGKGVQAQQLVDRHGFQHLSTGVALRAEVAAGSRLGQTVEPLLREGQLVPDDLVVAIVAERLARAARPVVLDGFPRTAAQARALDELLGDADCLAVHLDLPRSEAMARLALRQVCPSCETPSSEPWCTRCDGPTVRRVDDTPASIERRLELFDREVGPLLTWFAARDQLVTIDAHGPPVVVADRISAALAESTEDDDVVEQAL